MDEKTRRKTPPTRLALLLLITACICAAFLCSCNVTRTVVTSSHYFQKGDTTCTIVSKTIESYDATKKLNY